jgi:L-alanine-DL-glutamate epimerase-like enolase superfamily enzyme
VRDAIRTDSGGLVHAPQGPGLGIRVDWEAVEAATILHYDVTG